MSIAKTLHLLIAATFAALTAGSARGLPQPAQDPAAAPVQKSSTTRSPSSPPKRKKKTKKSAKARKKKKAVRPPRKSEGLHDKGEALFGSSHTPTDKAAR